MLIRLSELAEIELEEMRLCCVLRFWTKNDFRRFRYSSTQHRLIDSFLRGLRRQWLTSAPSQSEQPCAEVHDRTNGTLRSRCWYALQSELDRGEVLWDIFFQPEKIQRYATWHIGRTYRVPAHLLAITNRRLIWIAETSKDRSGLTVRYASPANLRITDICTSGNGYELLLAFGHGQSWELWFEPAQLPALLRVQHG
jgi:hypothetical protein